MRKSSIILAASLSLSACDNGASDTAVQAAKDSFAACASAALTEAAPNYKSPVAELTALTPEKGEPKGDYKLRAAVPEFEVKDEEGAKYKYNLNAVFSGAGAAHTAKMEGQQISFDKEGKLKRNNFLYTEDFDAKRPYGNVDTKALFTKLDACSATAMGLMKK